MICSGKVMIPKPQGPPFVTTILIVQYISGTFSRTTKTDKIRLNLIFFKPLIYLMMNMVIMSNCMASLKPNFIM